MTTNRLLVVSSSPHLHGPQTVRSIMRMVLLALLPAGFMGVVTFGVPAFWVIVTCTASSVGTEALWQKLTGRPVTVSDLSAAVTGLLLAYNLPPSIPLWMAAAGSAFAILVVKQLYGGLGKNVVNPALAARAVMLTCWPVPMTTWTLDGVTGPTPLAILKGTEAAGASLPPFLDVFLGHVGGCIGETSALALLLGGALLLLERVITWHIPVTYILTVGLLSWILGRGAGIPADAFYEVCAGGLFLGAIFMATDYATSPMDKSGQLVFAFGCGVLTTLIRLYGGYPEGVSYSILIMNLTVPLIDRFFQPRIFGQEVK
ncbi:RnfABCDGE type electron transport complex subunit D [Aminomonas paucivorans]|uniref:RnfABCDGE type electron transport complex subunit D n=1 Tax=Aminomonas paucivorans TaxID=81412 RepID=UPI0033315CBF